MQSTRACVSLGRSCLLAGFDAVGETCTAPPSDDKAVGLVIGFEIGDMVLHMQLRPSRYCLLLPYAVIIFASLAVARNMVAVL